MKILLRTFNNSINSKTGSILPADAPRRGTPEWATFENLFIPILRKYAEVETQKEHPKEPNLGWPHDRFGYVHKTIRDCPDGSLFWMQMHLRDLFTLDSTGWGADHSQYGKADFVDLPDEAVEFVTKLSDELWRDNVSKIDQIKEVDCEVDIPFILVPIQIPRDYTIQWHFPISVKYFIDSIQAWAHQAQTHVAFKLHPCNRMDIDLQIAVEDAVRMSRYCHRVDGNIHELIKRAIGLFVINSGTGFEALIHGQPVCTFGSCDYNLVTFNADIRRLDEARNFLFDYDEDKQKLARKFVFWYLHDHGFYLKDPAIEVKLEEFIKSWITNTKN